MSTRVELFLAARKTAMDTIDAEHERLKDIDPETLRIDEVTIASIQSDGVLKLSPSVVKPDNVIKLIEFLGKWFVAQVDKVEVADEGA